MLGFRVSLKQHTTYHRPFVLLALFLSLSPSRTLNETLGMSVACSRNGTYHDSMHFSLSKMKGQTARRNLPSLLVRARGGDELTVGKFLETLSRGCGCGPSRFGLGLNSDLKSALSKPSSNSCISSNSSASISPSYCSRSTDLGTETEGERVQSPLRATCSLSASNIHRPASYSPAKSPAQGRNPEFARAMSAAIKSFPRRCRFPLRNRRSQSHAGYGRFASQSSTAIRFRGAIIRASFRAIIR